MPSTRDRCRQSCPLLLLAIAAGCALAPLIPAAVYAQTPEVEFAPPQLSVCAGLRGLFDDTLIDTYGLLPSLGMRCYVPLTARSQFFIGASYTRDSGNPYYSLADFESDADLDLQVVPIEAGLRADVYAHPRCAFYLGAALEYIWAREEMSSARGIDLRTGPAPEEYSGWGWGMQFLMGPEWLLAQGKVAVGCEAALHFYELRLTAGNWKRPADLSGLGSRVYVSFRL